MPVNTIILKFGGTSVADANSMKNVAEIIVSKLIDNYKLSQREKIDNKYSEKLNYRNNKNNNINYIKLKNIENRKFNKTLVVFLSATAKTTDTLLNIINLALKGSIADALKLKEQLLLKHVNIIKDLNIDLNTNSNINKNTDKNKNISINLNKNIDKNKELLKNISELYKKLEILIKGICYLGEITPKAKDSILSIGELSSTLIFSAYFSIQFPEIKSQYFDIRKVMITDSNFTAANPLYREINKRCENYLIPLLKNNNVIITQGFIGSNNKGETTTLGRGGSDFSASIIGSCLHSNKIEIWTDVSGIFTADPRIVKNSYPQKEISFKEAAELAYFGAKVLHPSSILPAMEKNIPVFVKNTHKPQDYGTKITKTGFNKPYLKAIAFRKNVTMINIESTRMLNAYGFLAKIFTILSKYKISVDLISTSEISVSITLDSGNIKNDAISELEKYATVTIKKGVSIIALVSENIKSQKFFLIKVFDTLKDVPVEMITFGSSNVNLSLVIEDKYLEDAVKKLHYNLFEKN